MWNVPPISNPEKSDIKIPTRDQMEVLMVDRPDAVQTVIQFIMPGPNYGNDRRTQFWLLNTLLGGSFTSRLNMNLREEHGFTYGAGSAFQMRKERGHLVATSSVRADATGEALVEFLREFERLSSGDVSEEDATKARESLRTDLIQSFAALGGIIRLAFERVVNGQPMTTLIDDLRSIQSAGAAQLNDLAKSAVPLHKGVLVLVGDKKTILQEIAEIQSAGSAAEGAPKTKLPAPVEVDTLGNKIKS
jgi:predicted Zn-dependent peptidase